jgi:pimeloyl-ACP methyl ester carboxylesterase
MMGSRLALARGTSTVWIDPEHIASGALARLALRGHRPAQVRGVLLHAYALLHLKLRIAGFAPEFFAYDWRRGIAELGAQLAEHLRAPDAPRLLIAHSMGGLVARSALAQRPLLRLERLILVGTPHRGCFDPVLALRGTHPFVRSLARLDRRHSASWLAARVFSTFGGLYDLLPEREEGALDLLRVTRWPGAGPRPNASLLARGRRARTALAPADARMAQIAGVGQPTIEAVQPGPGGFAYFTRMQGDGTVPVARTRLAGLRTWYVQAEHGALLRHARVISALLDLLRTGDTRRLARRPSQALERLSTARRRARARTDDAALSAGAASKIELRELDRAQRAALLEELDGVPRGPAAAPRPPRLQRRSGARQRP